MDQLLELLQHIQPAAPAPEFCFLGIDRWWTCMTKAEWSGWVQALGSIAAIAGAVWLTQRQINAAAAAELQRRRDARKSFFFACIELFRLAESVRNHSRSDRLQRIYVDDAYKFDNFNGVVERLDSLLGQMAVADPLVHIVGVQLKPLGELLAAQVREMVISGGNDASLGDRFADAMGTVEIIEQQRPMVDALIDERSA